MLTKSPRTSEPNPGLLRGLIRHRSWVSARETVDAVHRRMRQDHHAFLPVCSQPGRLVGLVSLNQLGSVLGRRFGFDLYGSTPVVEHLLSEYLVFDLQTPVKTILDQVFSRPEDRFFDDIAIVSEIGILVGLIPVSKLVTLQHALYQEKMAEIEIHDRALREQNQRLEILADQLNDANRSLTKANNEVMAATRLKSEFLANMSHEIRTPMNGILGMTNLLLETELGDDQHELVDTVRESAEALLRIINDILDFSKIEAGKLEIFAETFSLTETVESCVLLVADKAYRSGLEIVTQIAPDVPDRVVGDGTRIRQILLNLIGNAIKFTEKGHVCLRLSLQTQFDEQAVLRFEVEDTGPGIPAEQEKYLFQPFKQVDASSTRRHGGTGLGLSICRNLVELMRGRIGCHTQVGKGSTFWMVLPLIQANRPTPLPPVPRFLDHAVLFLESHPLSREVLHARLLTHFREVHLASDSAEAQALLEQHGDAIQTVVVSSTPRSTAIHAWLEDNRQALAYDRQLIVLRPFTQSFAPSELAALNDPIALAKPVRRGAIQRALENLSAPPAVESPPVAPAPVAPEGRVGHILIVEDLPTNQRVIELLLKSLHFTFETASNGRLAIERMRHARFDIVLMDCQMPEMDGFEATRRIRTDAAGVNPASIPIIAMTANAIKGDREKCLAAGMNDYLPKPIRKEMLQATLQRHLRSAAE